MMHRVRTRVPRVPKAVSSSITFEEGWATLGPAFDAIHSHNESVLSYEELYRTVYKLILKQCGEVLYNTAVAVEQQWLKDQVQTQVYKSLTGSLLRLDHENTAATWREAKASGDRLLKITREQYKDHQLVLAKISTVLLRLDRDYCETTQMPSFHDRGTSLFRDIILGGTINITSSEPTTVLQLLPQLILDQIAMARAGEIIESNTIRECVMMLEWLPARDDVPEITTLYTSAFESEFLKSSTDFFRKEGEALLKRLDAPSYCKRVKARILEEQERCSTTLLERTAPLVIKIIDTEMIHEKMRTLVEMDSGIPYMVENDKKEEIELMYVLEARVDVQKTETIRSLRRIIASSGAAINKAVIDLASAQPQQQQLTVASDQSGDKTKTPAPADKVVNQQTVAALRWVEDILALKDKFDSIWTHCLYEDKYVQTSFTRSFTEVVNSSPRCSEYISLYIDEHMKKGIKGKTEAEVDVVLDKAIILVRHLQDKDMFEKYYKKHLCKRLLMGRSLSVDVEKSMIGRMKIELGNSFTTKLEAMFKDMTLSAELTAGYKKRVAGLGERQAGSVDLSINVLTSMTWPLEIMRGVDDEREDKIKTIYPPAIERLKDSFTQYYAQQHSGRVLTWQANMGTADIKATFPKVPTKEGGLTKVRMHELNVSTYSMIILVLFNDLAPGASLSFEDIYEQTRIPMAELKRNLQSLAVAPKTRILLKQPMSKDVKPADRFIFNEGFQGKFVKIKVGVVTAGNRVENDRERKETENATNDSRGFVIEAAIVRVMKQRKELSHAELVAETLTHLMSQFKPDVGMVKRKIESLIEREYLERMDEAPVPSYRYLA